MFCISTIILQHNFNTTVPYQYRTTFTSIFFYLNTVQKLQLKITSNQFNRDFTVCTVRKHIFTKESLLFCLDERSNNCHTTIFFLTIKRIFFKSTQYGTGRYGTVRKLFLVTCSRDRERRRDVYDRYDRKHQKMMILYRTVLYRTIRYDTIRYDTVRYGTAR